LVRAAFLQTHTALRVVAQVGALAEVSLGGGYLHRWHRRQSFTLDESKGTWEARPHPGSPSAMFGFGLGAGWRFSEVAGRPRPFVRYQFFGHTPYAEFAPLMAHSLLGLGLAVEL
jgi:hypothetical protein